MIDDGEDVVPLLLVLLLFTDDVGTGVLLALSEVDEFVEMAVEFNVKLLLLLLFVVALATIEVSFTCVANLMIRLPKFTRPI